MISAATLQRTILKSEVLARRFTRSRVQIPARCEVKKGGVRIRSGCVFVTGGYLRKNEPTEVSLSIGEEPTADMSITIEVQH